MAYNATKDVQVSSKRGADANNAPCRVASTLVSAMQYQQQLRRVGHVSRSSLTGSSMATRRVAAATAAAWACEQALNAFVLINSDSLR